MPFEGIRNKTNNERIRQQFEELRRRTHEIMKDEEETRLRENPKPTEDELYMGAFNEWLEPQVSDAIRTMYEKGYATESSGFHGEQPQLQMIDGYFMVDEQTKEELERIGIDVLRGPEIGLPRNKHITILRFRAAELSMNKIKARWDAVAAALPQKTFPAGIRPICDRAEEFRERYAPQHPSLDGAREKYFEYLLNEAQRS